MATSSTTFSFKLEGSYWDNAYDPFFQFANGPMPNTPDAIEFDEHGFWFTAGTSDGQQGNPSKMLLVVPTYQRDYQQGYDAGAWFRKVNHQG